MLRPKELYVFLRGPGARPLHFGRRPMAAQQNSYYVDQRTIRIKRFVFRGLQSYNAATSTVSGHERSISNKMAFISMKFYATTFCAVTFCTTTFDAATFCTTAFLWHEILLSDIFYQSILWHIVATWHFVPRHFLPRHFFTTSSFVTLLQHDILRHDNLLYNIFTATFCAIFSWHGILCHDI